MTDDSSDSNSRSDVSKAPAKDFMKKEQTERERATERQTHRGKAVSDDVSEKGNAELATCIRRGGVYKLWQAWDERNNAREKWMGCEGSWEFVDGWEALGG